MAFGDLVIEIIVKEKKKVLSSLSSESNNDIFDINGGMFYLEKRINDLAYKASKEVFDKRMK